MSWMKAVPISFRYLRFRFTARSPYRIHSHLLYTIVEDMRANRQALHLQHAYITYLHMASRCHEPVHNTGGTHPHRAGELSFAEYVRRVRLRYREWVALYTLCRYSLAPLTVELGTGAGTSTLALALALQDSNFRLVSVDASCHLQCIVSRLIGRVTHSRVEFVCADFREYLSRLTAQPPERLFAFVDGSHTYVDTVTVVGTLADWCLPESLVVVHDIHWSAEMEQAWQELTALKRVSLAVDMFYMGVLFVGFRVSKQVLRVNPWGPLMG